MIKSEFDLILEDCKDMGLLIGRGGIDMTSVFLKLSNY